MAHPPTISDTTLASVPHRRSRKDIVVLKFGGTTIGATRDQARITLARRTIADLLEQDKFVVPVFSAYRRGRSGSQRKFSVTDMLQNYKSYIAGHDSLHGGAESFAKEILDAHINLIRDLQLDDDVVLIQKVQDSIHSLKTIVSMSCSAFEVVPSLNDVIITAGERLAVTIMSAYLNRQHREGAFPVETAPVTALELGIYTDNVFGSATIDWARAVDHSREVILGQYLDRELMPIVTGFDGIYDPNNGFKEIMQVRHDKHRDESYPGVYRTSLGRGGSDLTATFLGLALDAEYVGFCKETPGVLTGDDMLIGKAAQTVRELDYDLATEAGNIYARAVEPVRAGGIPVHIFDPARPEIRTIVSDITLPEGLYIIERPLEAVNIHAGTIPDEPGALISFLEIFAAHGINVEEIRHQRSGTDCIVCGEENAIQKVIAKMHERGLRPEAHYTWYLRVIGNVSEELAATFNQFMSEFQPLTLATFQIGTKVLTATVVRNRAGDQIDEMQRIERITRQIHDELLVETVPRQQPGVEPPQLLTTG